MAKSLTGYIPNAGEEEQDRRAGNRAACEGVGAFGGPPAAHSHWCDEAGQGEFRAS